MKTSLPCVNCQAVIPIKGISPAKLGASFPPPQTMNIYRYLFSDPSPSFPQPSVLSPPMTTRLRIATARQNQGRYYLAANNFTSEKHLCQAKSLDSRRSSAGDRGLRWIILWALASPQSTLAGTGRGVLSSPSKPKPATEQ